MKTLQQFIKENVDDFIGDYDDTVLSWYKKEYPEDIDGAKLFEYASDLTWSELIEAFNTDTVIIEWSDSVIRECVFAELAIRLGITYDEVYDKWAEGKF